MTRPQVLEQLADLIIGVSKPHPVRVAIDGVDAAGKTTLADELVAPVESRGRPVIRANLDGFHRPRGERYRRGQDSPVGYYHDSFDYESVRDELLEQLGPGGSMRYRTATFDYRSDEFICEQFQTASSDSVLLFDGIFLLRSELNDLWDFRIFLQTNADVALKRAIERDATLLGSDDSIRKQYAKRYMPGQRIYLDGVRPERIANVVVDNNDLDNPRVLSYRPWQN